MQTPMHQLSVLLNDPAVLQIFLLPLGLILLDLVAGVADAAKHGYFTHRVLGSFMQSQVLPYVATVATALGTAIATKQGTAGMLLLTQGFLLPFYWSQLNSIADHVGSLTGANSEGLIQLARILYVARFHKDPPSAPVSAPVAEVANADPNSTNPAQVAPPAAAAAALEPAAPVA